MLQGTELDWSVKVCAQMSLYISSGYKCPAETAFSQPQIQISMRYPDLCNVALSHGDGKANIW